jgi:hypothetical protein
LVAGAGFEPTTFGFSAPKAVKVEMIGIRRLAREDQRIEKVQAVAGMHNLSRIIRAMVKLDGMNFTYEQTRFDGLNIQQILFEVNGCCGIWKLQTLSTSMYDDR